MLMLHMDFSHLLPDPTHNMVISFLSYSGNPHELIFGILDFDGGGNLASWFSPPLLVGYAVIGLMKKKKKEKLLRSKR